MKLENILKINSTISKIIDSSSDMDIDFEFKLLSILKAIEPQMQSFETLKNNKIMEYGSKSEDGNISIKDDNENYDKFVEEISKLLSCDVDIELPKISLNEAKNNGFKTTDLVSLFEILDK